MATGNGHSAARCIVVRLAVRIFFGAAVSLFLVTIGNLSASAQSITDDFWKYMFDIAADRQSQSSTLEHLPSQSRSCLRPSYQGSRENW
jgi:hypothetical protein